MSFLLEKGADTSISPHGRRRAPLHTAAVFRNAKNVQLLLEAGADVDLCISGGNTPLNEALYWGFMFYKSSMSSIVKLLIDAGADVNRMDDTGKTPLIHVINNNDIESVKLLIQAGADVNKASKYGDTPLKYARQNGDKQIETLLISAGATK